MNPDHPPLVHHARRDGPVQVDLLASPALTGDDAEQVFDWLLGRYRGNRILDGTRSVILPARGSGVRGGIKIKGAGFQGGAIRLGEPHDKPYRLPRYDAEGAATVDLAKDHGRAWAGGMSYQQARQEFTVSRYLLRRGMRVLAPLGYGSIRRDRLTSWFCLVEVPFREPRDWWQLMSSRDAIERIATTLGDTQQELARHDVFLALSGMTLVDEHFVRKDFHTCHVAGPDDSWLSRLSGYLFDANFILAHFHDRHLPGLGEHRDLARVSYLRALTQQECAPRDIDRFKELLVDLKFADWPMGPRIDRLASDPIGRVLLERFLMGSEEQVFFTPLPDSPVAPLVVPDTRPDGWLRRMLRRR